METIIIWNETLSRITVTSSKIALFIFINNQKCSINAQSDSYKMQRVNLFFTYRLILTETKKEKIAFSCFLNFFFIMKMRF